jgi:hypothetical protein
MRPEDFASVYLNRDWYLLVLDYINSRIENPDEKTSPKEIFDMHRLWMLQCIYGTTAKNLFLDRSQWFTPIRRIDIKYSRYSYIFRKLGADLPKINVNVGCDDKEQDETAERVWGSFNQHNDIIGKIETHIGNIGKHFLFETLSDITIDDDKLRHRIGKRGRKTVGGRCPKIGRMSFYKPALSRGGN